METLIAAQVKTSSVHKWLTGLQHSSVLGIESYEIVATNLSNLNIFTEGSFGQ